MAGHDIVVIGASAGGIAAIKRVASDLPVDLPAAILIVLHFPDYGASILADMINQVSRIPAHEAVDGEPVKPGLIYVAAPGLHLLIEDGCVRLTEGPLEDGFRPAINALFRSAALSCGQRVVGVVLTGLLRDGTAGLMSIKQCGGVAVVQDPDDAQYPEMPLSALGRVEVDYCLPLSEIASELIELAHDHAA